MSKKQNVTGYACIAQHYLYSSLPGAASADERVDINSVIAPICDGSVIKE
jgi:hypothetical protein